MLGILREGDDARARLRAALDLDLERPVVLYAPASRGRGRDPQPPLLDLDEWCAALGDRVYLLVRSHPAERLEISTRWRFGVRDVGEPSLIGDVLAASDLFVSDYSSLIGDAALARRPIMFFQPDRDDYVNRVHGLYVDLARVGPQARTTGELIAEVQAWLDDPAGWSLDHREMVRAFADDHCGPADGRSTERAVAALLGSALAPARGRDG
jgi:CDP-glycerol glycerophosphotransferase